MPVNANNVTVIATCECLARLFPGGVENLDNVTVIEIAKPLDVMTAERWLRDGLIAGPATVETEP